MNEKRENLPRHRDDRNGGAMPKKYIAMLLALVIGVASFLLASTLSSPERSVYSGAMEQLTDNRDTVMELMAASTAASAAITLLPDDWCTPIAEKLTDLSTGFLIVLSAIFIEKFLLTTIIYVALKFALPIVCLLCIFALWKEDKDGVNAKIIGFAAKFAFFFLVLSICIPASIGISGVIQKTYQTSIDQTISDAQSIAKEIEETDTSEDSNEEESFLDGLISKVSDVADGITSGATALVDKAQNCLNHFIEALAVMIVTSCVIPLIVLLILIALIKTFFGLDLMHSMQSVRLPGGGKHVL